MTYLLLLLLSYYPQSIRTSDAIPTMMTILKRGKVKELFHDAGIKRLNPNIITMLDEAVERIVERIADSCATVYPDQLLESIYLVRMCDAQGGWMISFDEKMIPDVDIKQLVRDLPLPDDLDEDDGG